MTGPWDDDAPAFKAVAEYGREHLGWRDATEQPGLGWETADAQHIVTAIEQLTEQLRVANLITIRNGISNTSPRFGELSDEIEKGLGLT